MPFVAGKLSLLDEIHSDSMEAKSINMVIAVLSGKGGTGKTLVSVNLASAAE